MPRFLHFTKKGVRESMNEIENVKLQTPIEWAGQVVITTSQLAEVYGTTTKNISNNFSRNKDRFAEGKHYFVLQGEELKEFMRVSSESGLPATTSIAYLWTRRGASRHCKILGTDRAWEQFDYLEDNYFDRQSRPTQFPTTVQGQIQLLAQGYGELHEEVKTIKKDLEDFKNDMPILGIEADEISNAVKRRVVFLLGGKQSNAYQDKNLTKRVFTDCYRCLRHNFGDITTYKAIRRNQVDAAVTIVQNYTPPLFLAETIETVNAQQRLSAALSEPE